jgi:3',5'-cyclic AMP phosphodiesterase CpdA
MPSIRILHASDLHISVHKQLRSALDSLGDLDDPWDASAGGIAEKLRIAKTLFTTWWKKMSASSYDPEILEALAEFIYEHAKRKSTAEEEVPEGGEKLDAVVLTGDLATTGSEDDIERVARFLEADSDPRCPYRSRDADYRGATLSAVQVPVLYLPGNHDRFVPTRRWHERVPIFFYPGGTHFDVLLCDHRRDPVKRLELVAEAAAGEKRLRVVVFTADFTLDDIADSEGFYGWLAQGRSYSNIRQMVVAKTEHEIRQKTDEECLCVLWALHFPPNYPGIKQQHVLLDQQRLIEGAKSAGVQAVLAGHTHRQLVYKDPTMPFWVYCCGTTTQHEPLATDENLFQIITITANRECRLNIEAKTYRFGTSEDNDRPRELRWQELPV